MELGASPLTPTRTPSQALPPAPVLPGLASVQSLTFPLVSSCDLLGA